MRLRTHLGSYLRIPKDIGIYVHIAAGRPLVFIPGRRRKRYANGFLRGELSSAAKRENERGRPGRVKEESTERESGGYSAGLKRGESVSPAFSLLRRDRARARIIFTEIKSKIRLALKCALDRACPNRRWLSEQSRSSYPEARRGGS